MHSTLEGLARAKRIPPSYVSGILRLPLLAPDIVEVMGGNLRSCSWTIRWRGRSSKWVWTVVEKRGPAKQVFGCGEKRVVWGKQIAQGYPMDQLPTDVSMYALARVRDAYAARYPGASRDTIERRARRVVADAIVLTRAAKSRKLLTYEQSQRLRGEGAGAAMNGNWLDDVHDYFLAPNRLPDATMLVVNGGTGRPNQDAFVEGRTRRSRIPLTEVPAEQQRAFERASELENLLGIVAEPLPEGSWWAPRVTRLGKGGPVSRPPLMAPETQAAFERDVQEALDRARARVAQEGKVSRRVGRLYDGSIDLDDTVAWRNCAIELMARSDRCALTGARIVPGDPHDGASIDRIDNSLGYFPRNLQLVTKFANRARGSMSVEEARKRLVQFRPDPGSPGPSVNPL